MSKQNNILDKILDFEFRPWLPQNSLDDVFASKFRSLQEYTPQQPLKFKIEFLRPFDNKTKYYSRLILNTVKSDFDTLYQTIDEDRNEKLVLYYLDNTLNKRLKTRLKDLGELLKEKDYSLAYINPKNTSHQVDQAHKANTYIMQLLKLGYMQLYLEIQESFKDYRDDIFIVEDFYTQFLNEPIPEQLPIKNLQVIEIAPKPAEKLDSVTNKINQFNSFIYKDVDNNLEAIKLFYESLKNQENINGEDKPTNHKNFKKFFDESEIEEPKINDSKKLSASFIPIKDDLITPPKKIHTYKQIVYKPDWFARFEKQLFDYGYINEEYRFTDRHGDKQILAAIYHQLILKDYFYKRTFQPNKVITQRHICKFLDNRYSTDVDRQFRNLGNDQSKLFEFIDKNLWLSKLASC
ncbi:hypothetical protein GYB57_04320 [bacterium]|nr:hypothetical protein [bacterium]